MKKMSICAFALSLIASSFAFADGDQHHETERFRMDCRFYGKKEHDKDRTCVASATYNVTDKNWISEIRYGVSCDRQTIYNDSGTYSPQEMVADQIRPSTAAVPRVELAPQNALRTAGTYTSKLETSDGVITNGVCYVTRLPSRDWNDDDGCDHEGSRGDCDDDHDAEGGEGEHFGS